MLVWAQPRQAHNIEKTYLSLPSLGTGAGSQACYQTVDTSGKPMDVGNATSKDVVKVGLENQFSLALRVIQG